MSESRADIAAESLVAAKRLELLAQQLRACVAEASLGLTPAMSRHDAEDLVDQCNQQLQVIVANATAIEEAQS